MHLPIRLTASMVAVTATSDAVIPLAALNESLVAQVMVSVPTPFDGPGALLTIGTDADRAELTGTCDLTAGDFAQYMRVLLLPIETAKEFNVYLTAAGSAVGEARVMMIHALEY